MADLTVDDQGSGQVEEGEIGIRLLLPPNEQATEAVEPGVGHLHDPTAWRMAGRVGRRGQWLRLARLRGDMRNEVMVVGGLPTGGIVVASVQSQVPDRRIGVVAWERDQRGVEQIRQLLHVVSLRA